MGFLPCRSRPAILRGVLAGLAHARDPVFHREPSSRDTKETRAEKSYTVGGQNISRFCPGLAGGLPHQNQVHGTLAPPRTPDVPGEE